jgi:hypothetical protein
MTVTSAGMTGAAPMDTARAEGGYPVGGYPVGGYPVGGYPVGGYPVGGHPVARDRGDVGTVAVTIRYRFAPLR